MPILRSDVLKEAREWIGTPFHHQQSVKNVGCDCAGTIKGVYRNLGVSPSGLPMNYPRTPSNNMLKKELAKVLDETKTPKPGDIILFTFINEPQHLGIYTETGGVIHAYQTNGKVVEHSMDKKWLRRVDSYWTHKDLIDG